MAAACAQTAVAAGPKLAIAWEPATASNYTRAGRPNWQVRKVVIHTTEGGFAGSVSWLRNPRSQASAHYVVSRTGKVAQLVRESDIAWHAGNYTINRESIGIEHEGFSHRSGTYTDAEYRASARLSAWIAQRYLLPIDRSRFIGHSDVPDPNNPKLKGGFAHHTDPGPYWNWSEYLRYVRAYAKGGKPPAVAQPAAAKPKPVTPTRRTVIRPGGSGPKIGPIEIANAGFSAGQNVSGWVAWQAPLGRGDVKKVEYLVDGVLGFTA
ncbi:MAG TPA: peptidoglycan recognition family protein, partial [Gammaproteobacteria bacterium]|nr:peptidoglycan recognition family protein [Gammaproteobacteria bacterium]